MGDAAVEDDRRFDPGPERLEAGLELGNHAAGGGAVLDQPAGLIHLQPGFQTTVLAEDAGDVGE